MGLNAKRICFPILTILMLFIPINVWGGGYPTMYGRVWLSASSGKIPLKDAKVRLLFPGNNQIVAETYTDSQGNFSFYGVIPKGRYDIEISLGNKVMNLQVGNTMVRRLNIEFSGQCGGSSEGMRIPDILATP